MTRPGESSRCCLPQPALWDGATGTELQKRGMPRGVCTEQWILEHPEALLELQRAYVAAGADILTAPTFGASPALLAPFGLEDRVEEFNRRLVALSRRAAGGKTLVAGDLTTCGMGSACGRAGDFMALPENYRAQVSALRAAGVDLYLIETMVEPEEARAALLAVKEADPGKPAVVTFTCNREGRTPAGADVLAALLLLQSLGADGFGLNCTAPGIILEQMVRLAPFADIPLMAQPNGAGESPEAFAAWAEKYAGQGVRLFGGCCGSGPADIAAVRRRVDSLHLTALLPGERPHRAPERPAPAERNQL